MASCARQQPSRAPARVTHVVTSRHTLPDLVLTEGLAVHRHSLTCVVTPRHVQAAALRRERAALLSGVAERCVAAWGDVM